MIINGREREILAPAGNFESLKAALMAGADSVYFGMGDFNARRKASNFATEEEVRKAVDYCHIRGKKAHLTLNTLLYDDEIKNLDIEKIASFCFDAIIVQDVGVFNLLKNNTNIPLHASTQLTAHNVSEVIALEDLGFKRVVLSREMSFREIERVIKRTNVEIEVFIHGALCMCVSGQCYFSSALGRRSGNRGLCAGVCRLPFYVNNKGNYDLSLKDLSHIDYIKNLSDIGVKSFKIEGRMKSKEYVYTVVDEITKSIRGEYNKEKLKKTFSRNGFTDGYYKGEREKNMFGTKSEKSEVNINFKEKTDKSKVKIDMSYFLIENEKAKLSLKDMDNNEVEALGEVVQSAINAPLNEEKVKSSLLKLNDSAYFVDMIDGDISKNAFLPIKDINNLRREAVGELDDIRRKREYAFYGKDIKLIGNDENIKEKIALFYDISNITDKALLFFDKIFIPLFRIDEVGDMDTKKAGVILPRVYFEDEEKLRKYLLKAKEMGIKYAYCNGVGKVDISIKEGFEIYLGFGNNITNSYALNFISKNIKNLKSVTVSFENTFNNINKLVSNIPLGVIVYGYIPLMITRNCPVKNEMECMECGGKSYLTDRMGKKFRVRCENGLSSIYNTVPTCVFDRLDKLNDNISSVFMFNSDDDVDMVIARFKKRINIDNFTRGCYFRKLD